MADLTVTAADVRPLPGAIIQRFIASAAMSVGDIVHKGSTTTQVTKSDASAVATGKSIGIVVSVPNGGSAAVAGDYVDVVLYGPVAGFSSLTPAGVGYLSETAGKLADAAPSTASSVVWPMGWAMSASIFFFDPGMRTTPATALVTLTDSTGLSGSHDDTLAATTVPTTLTDSTGLSGSHNDTLEAVTTFAASVAWNGSSVYPSAADETALATAITALNQNASDTAQKIIELVTLITVMTQNQSDVAQKVIEIVAALKAAGININ